MPKLVKGENVKNSIDDNLKENIIELPKEDKTRKFFVTTDEEGNIKGYFPIKEKTLGKDWIAMYQSALISLAKWDLPNEQYRVFLMLLGKLDFDNYLRISQKDISEELNIKQPHISRAISELCKKNVLVEGPRAGLNKTYRLNPYIAHKGKNRSQTILDFESASAEQGKNALNSIDTKE